MFSHGQDSTRRNHPILEIGLIATSVVAGAVSDGLNSRTKYHAGHALAIVSWGSLLALPFVVKPNWRFPVSYLLLRYALFDGFYNLGAKRSISYEGGKNFYDEGAGKVPLSVLHASKFAAIGLTVVINLNRNRKLTTPLSTN